MIISVRVPADVFSQAANTLKIHEYYVLHVAREGISSEDIRAAGAGFLHPIIRVMNEENESEWFLSQCESIQGNVMIFSYDILLTGITEVTDRATLDLLNMTPYNRHGDAWWDMVEGRAREALRTHSTDVGIRLADEIVDYRHPYRDSVDSLVDAAARSARAVRVWYNDPLYQSFLSSLHSQPLNPIEEFVPSDYVTSGAPIIKVDDEPRFEEPKDAKPQMSINDLLFGGD